MKYTPKWDLTTVPLDLLWAEIRRRQPGGRPKVEVPCVKCKAPLTARQRRQPCPHCGARNPR